MTPKTSAQLIDRVSLILEDAGNAYFADATITSQLQECVAELSEYSPLIVRHTKLMENSARLGTQLRGNKGREIDIADIDNLRYIDKIEYEVDNYPPTFRNFQQYDKRVYLDIKTRPSAGGQDDSSGASQVLTGTVTFTAASTAVTGSGTAFTSELEVGDYIRKSGGSNWYRVAFIVDDTTLTLSMNCATADTGADTADSTLYWYEYAYLYCAKNHYVEATQTDFTGEIDAGVAGGYAHNVRKIHVDALGTGAMPKDMLFTIDGTLGVYRITKEATITATEADIEIEPRLKERANENVAITFYGSSLNQEEERLLCELTAARLVMNWMGKSRTAIDAAISATSLGNASCDSMAAILTQLALDVASMRSVIPASLATAKTAISNAANKTGSAASAAAAIDTTIGDYTSTSPGDTAHYSLGNAFDQLDFAIANIAVVKDAIAAHDGAIDAEVGLVKTQIDTAVVDLTTDVDNVNNTITTGSNVVPNLISKAMGEMSAARAYIASAETLKNPNSHYGELAESELRLAMAQIREAQGYIALEGTITSEHALAVRSHIATAQGYIREADAYIRADAQNVASYGRTISAELSSAIGYVRQAGGYFQEANTSIRTTYAISAMNRWAQTKLQLTLAELRRMRKPRQKSFSYSRE